MSKEAKVLAKAISIASRLYQDKFDRWGNPYILHCIRVMQGTETTSDLVRAAAILHDVVEDGLITLGELSSLGMPIDVLYLVEFLTHKEGETYDEYIEVVWSDLDAVEIKLADLKDNSDITRLKWISEKDLARMAKYHKAYTYLKGIKLMVEE